MALLPAQTNHQEEQHWQQSSSRCPQNGSQRPTSPTPAVYVQSHGNKMSTFYINLDLKLCKKWQFTLLRASLAGITFQRAQGVLCTRCLMVTDVTHIIAVYQVLNTRVMWNCSLPKIARNSLRISFQRKLYVTAKVVVALIGPKLVARGG